MQENKYNDWHLAQSNESELTSPWNRYVIEYFELLSIKNIRVLEIGCGRGALANHLIQTYGDKIMEYKACDYSIEAINIAMKRYSKHEKLTWEVNDIQNISYPDNTFDIIISCETIEHIPDSNQAIKELYRVCKMGGSLILTCPNYFNQFGLWCLYRYLFKTPFTEGGQPFLKYILAPVIQFRLKKHRFKIVKYSSSEIILPFRKPKTYCKNRISLLFSYLGYRTFYLLKK